MNQRSGTALEWLSAAAFDPRVCEWRWRQDELGTQLLPAGRLWDVLMLPLQPGLLVLGTLLRGARKPGPALADFVSDQVGFFVPPRVMGRWTDAGSRLAGPGTWIVVPLPGRHVRGLQWLCPPDGQGTLNDPEALKAALRSTVPSATGVPAQPARHPRDDPQASSGRQKQQHIAQDAHGAVSLSVATSHSRGDVRRGQPVGPNWRREVRLVGG